MGQMPTGVATEAGLFSDDACGVRMTLISAHRGGRGALPQNSLAQNSLAGLEAAVEMGCDFVEFDVRLTADGHAVLAHDDVVMVAGVSCSIADQPWDAVRSFGLPTLAGALAVVGGRIGAHVDLKVHDRGFAVVRAAVEAVGVDHLVVTTSLDSDVRLIMRWAARAAPGLRVGLSTASAPPTGRRRHDWPAAARSWFPRTRVRRSGANVVAAHHWWARWWLRRWADEHDLPLLVWTVNSDRDLARWIEDPLTWIVATNRPARALELRVSSP